MMFRTPADGRRLALYAGPVPIKGPDRKRHFVSGSLVALGVGEATAAIMGPAITGALLGAGTSALTGGDMMQGALFGAALGGVGGAVFGGAAGAGGAATPLEAATTAAPVGTEAAAAATGATDLTAGLGTGVAEGLPTAMTGSGMGAVTSAALPEIGQTAGQAALSSDLAAAAAPAGIDQGSWDMMFQPGGALARSGDIAGAAPAAKGISNTALALGALSAGSKLLAGPQKPTPRPGPETTAATQGPFFNQPLQPYTGPMRTPADLSALPPNYWYTYGQRPEQQFFANNSLKNFGMATMAKGGALSRAGQPEFSTATGERYVQGPGTGTSDSVPAQLSDGEYVLTAKEVADIGQGSNRAGALALDRMRKAHAAAKSPGKSPLVRYVQSRAA